MLDLARIFNSRIILLEHAAPERHSDGTIKHRRGREHMLVKSYFLNAGRNSVVLAVARGGTRRWPQPAFEVLAARLSYESLARCLIHHGGLAVAMLEEGSIRESWRGSSAPGRLG